MGPLFYGSPAEDGRTDGLCTDKALRIPLRQKVKETRVEGIEEEGGADAKERGSGSKQRQYSCKTTSNQGTKPCFIIYLDTFFTNTAILLTV